MDINKLTQREIHTYVDDFDLACRYSKTLAYRSNGKWQVTIICDKLSYELSGYPGKNRIAQMCKCVYIDVDDLDLDCVNPIIVHSDYL